MRSDPRSPSGATVRLLVRSGGCGTQPGWSGRRSGNVTLASVSGGANIGYGAYPWCVSGHLGTARFRFPSWWRAELRWMASSTTCEEATVAIESTVFEQRLVAVEAAVSEIMQRLGGPPNAPDWIERVTGSFREEPAFDEVLRLGRAAREADRPREERGA